MNRENKAEFIKKIEELLKSDYRSNVEKIDYLVACQEEVIIISFEGGGRKRICATANSNGANLKAITEAVY